MSLKPFTRKQIALDRAVARIVMDASGGCSYSDILDNSTEAQDLLRDDDDHDEEVKDPEDTDTEEADAMDKRRRRARDTGAMIQTSRRKATLTGVR